MRLHAAPTIVYVDASASGTGDGSSWANASPSLIDALAGAASGTEIWVAKGAYKPTSGTGNLYWWDARLNGGLGDWALAQSAVSYTINFYDSGTSGKSSSDTFGIRIVYTPVAPQPSALPNSTPQLLKGGDIKVS